MKKKNVQSKIATFFKGKKKRLICAIGALIILVVGVTAACLLLNDKSQNSTKTTDHSKEKIVYDKSGKVSVTTNELIIKEWNMKAPVNGNILGTVTYTISSDKSKVTFSSSKLNELNLSSDNCVKGGVTKNAWGVSRSKKKAEYAKTEKPYIIGDYEYKFVVPSGMCNEALRIGAAFNYLDLYMGESK